MRTEYEILQDINDLYMALSPENISWDGMRSPAQVRKETRKIEQLLYKLFIELGREVDEYEVMKELRASRGRRSAKQTTSRSASEVINNLEQRIARLEKSSGRTRRRVPRDHFRRPSRNIMPRDMDKVRSKAIPPDAYDDIPFSGGQHDFYGALHELVEEGYESDEIVKKLTRRFKVKAPFILEMLRKSYGEVMRVASTSKVAGHIILAGDVNVRQLRRELEDTFGVEDIDFEDGVLTFLMSSMDNKKIEREIKSLAKKHDVKFEKGEFTDGLGMIYTKNASRRTAAKLLKRHIKVLEKNKSRIKGIMFYDQLPQDIIRDLERVKWTETLHMDVERWLGDNVSGLRSRWASRRNRRASKPMFNLALIKETLEYDEDTSVALAPEEKELFSKKIYSFDELLEELEDNRIFYGWSWEKDGVSHTGNKLSITSSYEEVMMAYAEERACLHINLARGVVLSRSHIKQITTALGIR